MLKQFIVAQSGNGLSGAGIGRQCRLRQESSTSFRSRAYFGSMSHGMVNHGVSGGIAVVRTVRNHRWAPLSEGEGGASEEGEISMRSFSRVAVVGALALPLAFAGSGLALAGGDCHKPKPCCTGSTNENTNTNVNVNDNENENENSITNTVESTLGLI